MPVVTTSVPPIVLTTTLNQQQLQRKGRYTHNPYKTTVSSSSTASTPMNRHHQLRQVSSRSSESASVDDHDEHHLQLNNTITAAVPPPRSSLQQQHYHRLPRFQTDVSRFVFAGIHKFCPNDANTDILRYDFATDLQEPFIYSETVPQDGKLKSIVALGHIFALMCKKYKVRFVRGVLGAILNPLGIPVYSLEYDEKKPDYCSFFTEDSCVTHAVVALEGRILFDDGCFWYAATRAGVQVMSAVCDMLCFFRNDQTRSKLLVRGLPLRCMTACPHRHCFNRRDKTSFPFHLQQYYSPHPSDPASMEFFHAVFSVNEEVLASNMYSRNVGRPVSLPLQRPLTNDAQHVAEFRAAFEEYFSKKGSSSF